MSGSRRRYWPVKTVNLGAVLTKGQYRDKNSPGAYAENDRERVERVRPWQMDRVLTIIPGWSKQL